MGTDDVFKAAVSGGLKLKGASGGVKKKERKEKKAVAAPAAGGGGGAKPAPLTDTRTASERAFEERQAREELKSISKSAALTHREKVAAFNSHLAKLSEHHDIPRVGPG